jgi:hypothetical protein
MYFLQGLYRCFQIVLELFENHIEQVTRKKAFGMLGFHSGI